MTNPFSYGHSIVLLGNFNPKIFHPSWFGAQQLIGKQEEEGANVEIVHSDVAIFSLDWLRLEVFRDRFKAETTKEPYIEALLDFVVGTFTLLKHTPLTMMGINIEMHFRIASTEIWHAAGDRLAPKAPWDGILTKPGMGAVIMQDVRTDSCNGYLRVTVEPSSKIQPGIFFSVNDHIEVSDPKKLNGSDELVDILKGVWLSSRKRSENIIHTLFERITS